MSSCSSVPQLEVPPGIDPSGKFVVIVNEAGITRLLANLPSPSRGVLIFDGADIYFADGSFDLLMALSGLQVLNNATGSRGLLVVDADKQFFGLVNNTPTKMLLRSYDGTLQFEVDPTGNGLMAPLTGKGFVIKHNASAVLEYLSSQGLVYNPASGDPVAIPPGANGQVMSMVAGEPTWTTLPSGNIASGASSIGLEGVSGSNTAPDTVAYGAPVFTLSNGTVDLKTTGLNVGAAFVAGQNGLGKLDVGAEAASTWYYVYAVSNGTLFNAMISLSPVSPNFSNTAGYTYWGLMGVFRNDPSSNIVPFIQRGRDISIQPQLVGDNMNINTSWVAAVGSNALNTILPPNVKACSGSVGATIGASGDVLTMVASTDVGTIGAQAVGSTRWTAPPANIENFDEGIGSFKDLLIANPAAPQIFWRANASNSVRRMMIYKYKI